MESEGLQTKLDIATFAASIANKENIGNATDFALKNSKKFTPEVLKAILNHQKFNETIAAKIPDWAENISLICPERISLEQASSKITAEIKNKYLSGNSILDITGGLGVDSFYFSKIFQNVVHNEPSAFLSAVVQHNLKALNCENIVFTQYLAEEYPLNQHFDWLFIDPDRRNTENKKQVLLSDCKPDIAQHQSHWFSLAPSIMIKLSPMLDIKACLESIQHVKNVLIISEKNEVKELLLILEKDYLKEPKIVCLNKTEKVLEKYEFVFSEEQSLLPTYLDPQKYIYVPNASIMKAGAFKSIQNNYNLEKIAPNSHIYSSNAIIDNFPGRTFELIATEKPDKKSLEKHILGKQANIACRNYPTKPEQIKKELGWKDGGDWYVFFTENQKKKKIVLICRKIQKNI